MARVDVVLAVLDAAQAWAGGIAKSGPGLHRLRRLPSQWPDRRCGIRNSGEQTAGFLEGAQYLVLQGAAG
jgi:hypothetical protein